MTTLLREKKEALLLTTKIQEQYNTLTSELKAKVKHAACLLPYISNKNVFYVFYVIICCNTLQTVALEELNLEYINLKRALGGKDELNTHLVSLKTQYSNIKAKVSNLLFGGFGADLSFACALIN